MKYEAMEVIFWCSRTCCHILFHELYSSVFFAWTWSPVRHLQWSLFGKNRYDERFFELNLSKSFIQRFFIYRNIRYILPAGNYMLKTINNTNARTRCEICSKLTIKTPERLKYVIFDHISHLALVFLLLTLSR